MTDVREIKIIENGSHNREPMYMRDGGASGGNWGVLAGVGLVGGLFLGWVAARNQNHGYNHLTDVTGTGRGGCCPVATQEALTASRLQDTANTGVIIQTIALNAKDTIDSGRTGVEIIRAEGSAAAVRLADALAFTNRNLDNGFCNTDKTIVAATDLLSAKINCVEKSIATLQCATGQILGTVNNIADQLVCGKEQAQQNEITVLREKLAACHQGKVNNEELALLNIINAKVSKVAA